MKALLKIEWIKTWRSWPVFIMSIGMPVGFFLLYSGMEMGPDPEPQKAFILSYMLTLTGFSMSSFGFFTFPYMLREDQTEHTAFARSADAASLYRVRGKGKSLAKGNGGGRGPQRRTRRDGPADPRRIRRGLRGIAQRCARCDDRFGPGGRDGHGDRRPRRAEGGDGHDGHRRDRHRRAARHRGHPAKVREKERLFPHRL